MINGQAVAVPRQGFLTMAFVWMFVGVLLSAAATYVTLTNETLFAFAAQWYLALLIAQFALRHRRQRGHQPHRRRCRRWRSSSPTPS